MLCIKSDIEQKQNEMHVQVMKPSLAATQLSECPCKMH
jgi:hypothetical protein